MPLATIRVIRLFMWKNLHGETVVDWTGMVGAVERGLLIRQKTPIALIQFGNARNLCGGRGEARRRGLQDGTQSLRLEHGF